MRKRLGELLLERNLLTREQLEVGLAHHRATRQRLGVALIQKGLLSEEQLCNVLSHALAIPLVDLKRTTPDWEAVHLLRPRFCESNDLFPFDLEASKGRRQLLVAMADPLNVPALEEIEFTTGHKAVARLAPLSAIRSAILKHYHRVVTDDAPDGKMTLVGPGGRARVVDTETGSHEIPELEKPKREITERTALANLIAEREEQRRAKKAKKAGPSAVAKDLDFLFGDGGEGGEGGEVEKLQRKFWALMRLMAKKGLITRAEFLKELEEE